MASRCHRGLLQKKTEQPRPAPEVDLGKVHNAKNAWSQKTKAMETAEQEVAELEPKLQKAKDLFEATAKGKVAAKAH